MAEPRDRNQPPAPPRQHRPGQQAGDAHHDVLTEIRRTSRPWSEEELLAEMQRVNDALDEDIATLVALGTAKAQAQSDLDKTRARELLICYRDRPEMKTDALRQAFIVDQTSVGDLMLAADLAATLYWDQAATIKARMSQIDLLRSMMRSIRDRTEDGQFGRSGAQRGQRR